jgi:hypothetical protein
VARGLARYKYKLDFVGVQVWRDKEGAARARDYPFFNRKGNESHQFGEGFVVHHRILSVGKRGEFVRDRLSYTV